MPSGGFAVGTRCMAAAAAAPSRRYSSFHAAPVPGAPRGPRGCVSSRQMHVSPQVGYQHREEHRRRRGFGPMRAGSHTRNAFSW